MSALGMLFTTLANELETTDTPVGRQLSSISSGLAPIPDYIVRDAGNVWNGTKNAFNTTKTWIGNTANNVSDWTSDKYRKAKAFGEPVDNSIRAGANFIGDTAVGAFNGVRRLFDRSSYK